MNGLNVERILNGTPTKKLASQYNTLKESFTKENAEKYKTCYESMDLYDIMENSEYIFKEPYYGSDFYMECIKYFPPSQYKCEYDKVTKYMNGIYDLNCPEDQKTKCRKMQSMLSDMIDRNKNMIALSAHFTTDGEPPVNERELYNALYQYNKSYPDVSPDVRDTIDGIVNKCNDPYAFFIYVPKACSMIHDYYGMNKQIKNFCNPANTNDLSDDEYKKMMLSKTIASTLGKDTDYQGYINDIKDPRLKCVMENLCKSCPSKDYKDIYKENVEDYDPSYTSPADAVNRIFDDEAFYESVKDENNRRYMERREKQHITDSVILEMAMDMYYESDDPEHELFVESDFTNPSDTIMDVLESYFEKENEYDVLVESFLRKNKDPKPENPKESFTDKVRDKGLRADMKTKEFMGKAKRKGSKVKGAIKGVLSAPTTILNQIKATASDFKNASDEKKKEMIAKPGYRKKIFKSFKLAILYGGTAMINIMLVPFLMILRNVQKGEDKRLREELLNELQTELHILDEKISDAQSAGDNKEKYQLMRTKGQLEQELVRVTLNGKSV